VTTNITGLNFDESAIIVVEALNALDSSASTFETTKLDMQDQGVMFEYDVGSGAIKRTFIPWSNIVAIHHGVS
jgi:hypothetical protein